MRNRPTSPYALSLVIAVLITSCATTPNTGSKTWHQERIAEIEVAYQNGEMTEEAYLSLKTEADAVRVQYQNAARSQLHYGGYPSFPRNGVHHTIHHHHRP